MVSSSYAASLGYVARTASDEAILKVATYVNKLYFDSEDERSRTISGEIIRAIAKYATDRFASLAAAFLPLVFVALNDEAKDVKVFFKETWDDNTGGNRAASLYFQEIIALASEHLGSKRWVIKHGAAVAVAEAMEAVAKSRGDSGMTEAEASAAWPALKIALAEKSWDGKERVLAGLSTLITHASNFLSTRTDVCNDIAKVSFGTGESWRRYIATNADYKQIALREAGRRNAKYRPDAIKTLGDVAASPSIRDMCDDMIKLLGSIIDDMADKTNDLVDDHAESERL